MIHRANLTQVASIPHRFQLRILIQKLPSLILRIIPHLLLPRSALASPMARVRTERGKRSLVTILPFTHTLIPIVVAYNPHAQPNIQQEHEEDDGPVLPVAQLHRHILEVREVLALPFLLHDRLYIGDKGTEVKTVAHKPVTALHGKHRRVTPGESVTPCHAVVPVKPHAHHKLVLVATLPVRALLLYN